MKEDIQLSARHGKKRERERAGSHRNVHTKVGVDVNVDVFEDAPRVAALDAALEGHDLLCDHAQHLDGDAVELVEARPRAGAGEPFEELAHGSVVELVAAVEDDALLRQRLGQVFGGLSLASARGACWGAAKDHLQRAHDGEVALIC